MRTPTFRLRHNLTLLLKEHRLTATQLSGKTGIAKQVLSDWMAGVQPRKIEHLYLVAQTLNVSLEDLCFSEAPTRSERAGIPKDTQVSKLLNQADEIRGRYEVYLRRIAD